MASRIQNLINKQDDSFTDDEVIIKNSKGVKLNNDNSTVKVNAPPINMRETIARIVDNDEELKKWAFTLTSRLLGTIKDKTLDENKDAAIRDKERQVFSEFAEFARVINSDPNKEDCYGTLSYVNALSRCILMQRDRINELEYETVKLQKVVKVLQDSVDKIKVESTNK